MPARLPDNWREALEAEATGLQARISATEKTDPDDERIVGWRRRLGEIAEQGGPKPTRKERAVEKTGSEKRPG